MPRQTEQWIWRATQFIPLYTWKNDNIHWWFWLNCKHSVPFLYHRQLLSFEMQYCNLPSLKLSHQKNVGLQNVSYLSIAINGPIPIATSLDLMKQTNMKQVRLINVSNKSVISTTLIGKFWVFWRVSFPNEAGHWCLYNRFVPPLTLLEVQIAKALLVVSLNKKVFYNLYSFLKLCDKRCFQGGGECGVGTEPKSCTITQPTKYFDGPVE